MIAEGSDDEGSDGEPEPEPEPERDGAFQLGPSSASRRPPSPMMRQMGVSRSASPTRRREARE